MSKTVDVKIKTRGKAGATGKETIVQYTFADSLDEAKEWYGENLCLNLINKSFRVGAQAAGRPLLEAGKLDEVQAAVSAFKPEEGSRRGRVKYIADMDSLREEFSNMAPAQKANMIAMFEAYLRGEEAPSVENGDDDDDENGGDDDDEDADQPAPTESPPTNVNRAQQRKRGPRLNFD
jgi:hypothetical protein